MFKLAASLITHAGGATNSHASPLSYGPLLLLLLPLLLPSDGGMHQGAAAPDFGAPLLLLELLSLEPGPT